MECVVCVEPFTKKRTKIHCNCGLDVCINCAKRYILERLEVPHCMSCKNRWTKQFLYENFKPSFVNGEYRKTRKKILLDNELAKLPITQEYLEVEDAFDYLDKKLSWDKWSEDIKNQNNISIIRKYPYIKVSKWVVNIGQSVVTQQKTYRENIIDKLILIYRILFNSNRSDKEITISLLTINNTLYSTNYGSYSYIKYKYEKYRNMWADFKKGVRYEDNGDNGDNLSNISPKSKFIHKCPDENCKGFVSRAYKCGLCKKFTCSKCLEIKGNTQDAKHICNEDSIKSAEIIKKNTKACPKCGTRIFKINGCDQMWCTSCNTAFNWVTGSIYASNANFHNPHYIDWVTSNEGNRNDVNNIINCGNLPNLRRIYKKFLKAHQGNKKTNIKSYEMSYDTVKSYLKKIYRFTSHIIDITIQKLRDRTIIREEKNTDLRIRYMKNEITKAHLSKIARMRDNVIEKNVAMIQILEIFTDTMINQFNNILSVPKSKVLDSINLLIDTAFKIRIYCNEQMANISKNYKMKVYQISENFSTLDFDSLQMIKSNKKTIVI